MLRYTPFIAIMILACIGISKPMQAEAPTTQPTYDPLRVSEGKPTILDRTIHDAERKRDIPVRIYMPADPALSEKQLPMVLFSHGLGGSRAANPYLGNHWARRGYIVVFMQHAGSDENVWKNAKPGERREALKAAPSPQNYLARTKDVSRVIDQLETWQNEEEHPLHKRLDLTRLAMTGHSYGGATTQAVSGQWNPRTKNELNDPRIKDAIVMSPSFPRKINAEKTFAAATIPWLLMTGTKDDSPLRELDPKTRTKVFDHLPKGDKYLLVLWEAQHYAFGDGQGRRIKKRNPNHHRVILGTSTAFLDAHLNKDPAAKAWLTGKPLQEILEEKDEWKMK